MLCYILACFVCNCLFLLLNIEIINSVVSVLRSKLPLYIKEWKNLEILYTSKTTFP